MADDLMGTPGINLDTVVRLARVFAQVHAEIHTCSNIPGPPSQRELFSSVIHRIAALPPDLKEATIKAFDEMPQGDRLCHGDFHPYNVLMSARGPVVIDWNNAHIGDPLEDVARSRLMLSGVARSEPSFSPLLTHFIDVYLEHYFELLPGDQQQLVAWRPIVAAVRLSDNIPELEGWLLEQIRTGLAL